jgi:hypothetical protein
MPDLVTYSGPSTAAVFVAGVFNDAAARADDTATDASAEFTTATNVVADIPASNAEGLAPSTTLTAATIDLTNLIARQGDVEATQIEIADVLDGLVDKLDAFMAQFFPDIEDAVAAARATLVSLFAGANMADGRALAALQIDEAVEKSERNRVFAEREVVNRFAARGYRAPPGRLGLELMQLERQDMHGIIDTAREADRSAGAREASNLARMLELLKSTRAKALDAFGSFLVRACNEKFAQQRITQEARFAELMQLEDKLRETLVLTNRAAALQLNAKELDYNVERSYLQQVDKLVEQTAEAELNAALQLAKVLGSLAAQAYNNLRGGATISLSEDMNAL